MVIQIGDSTAAVKQEISNLLDYVTGDGEITSWLNATNRINEVADIVGRDGIADGMAGATARARINALWDGPVWAPGADLAMDFREGLYYRGTPTDTHATDILALGSTGYQTFAPNVLPRTDLGLLTTVGRTNKCENWNANPTDLTRMTKVGDEAATLTVVDDSAELAAAGLDGICTSGMVFKIDNSAGTGQSIAGVFGDVGNLNQHIASAWVRGGSGSISASTSADGSASFNASASYRRLSVVITPSDSGKFLTVRAAPGQIVYFILNQLEEGPFATDPIITEGSAVTRPGNMPVIDLTGRLGAGFCFVGRAQTLAQDLGFTRLIELNSGNVNNQMRLQINPSGALALGSYANGTQDAVIFGVSEAIGMSTYVLAFDPSGTLWGYTRKPSGAYEVSKTNNLPLVTDLTRLALLGNGYGTNANQYGIMSRLAGFYTFDKYAEAKALADAWYAEATA